MAKIIEVKAINPSGMAATASEMAPTIALPQNIVSAKEFLDTAWKTI